MGLQFDLWVPATLAPVVFNGSAELEARNQRGYAAIGKLREGATEAQAAAQLIGAMGELAGRSQKPTAASAASYGRSGRRPAVRK